MKNNYNIVLTIFIWMVIVRHIISIVSSIPLIIAWPSSDYISIIALGWNIVLNISMIIILLYLLKEKRWSIYLFCGLQIINVVFQSIFLEGDFLNSLIIAITLCIIMAALLCLKKDGISAWKLLFSRDQGVSDDELIISSEIEDAVIEDNTDNLASQNSVDEDSISADQGKEQIEENIIQKESEREVPEITATNNVVEDISLTDLPYKEDGTIDYENMTSVQQFVYTSKTESIEVALMDLNADIKTLEKSIGSIQKGLKSLQGGNRAMLRDSLRKEQEKLEELYELRRKYSSKKNGLRKYILIIIVCLVPLIPLISFVVKRNTNLVSEVESQNNENIKLNWSTDFTEEDIYFVDDLSSLYHNLLSNSYTLEELGNEKAFRKRMSEEKNRKILYDYIVERGDFIIGEFVDYEKRVLLALDREWLYEILTETYEYDLISYDVFYKKMDDEEIRKAVYDAAIEEGLEVGTWEEFNEMFGR